MAYARVRASLGYIVAATFIAGTIAVGTVMVYEMAIIVKAMLS